MLLYKDMTEDQKRLFDGIDDLQELRALAKEGVGLDRLANIRNYAIRELVAENAETPTEIVDALAYDAEESVRCRALANPNVSEKVLLDYIAKDKESPSMSRAEWAGILGSAGITRRVADEAMKGDALLVWFDALAANPHASADVLEGRAKYEIFHETLAENPSCPVNVLAELAEHGGGRVLLALAKRKDLPSEVQSILACDGGLGVSSEIARRKDLSPESADILATRWMASTVFGKNNSVVAELCKNPSTHPRVLLRLAENPENYLYLAGNPNLPSDMMHDAYDWARGFEPNAHLDAARLIRDVDYLLADNPSTPHDILLKYLANGEDRALQLRAMLNPSLSLVEIMDICELESALNSRELYEAARQVLSGNHGMSDPEIDLLLPKPASMRLIEQARYQQAVTAPQKAQKSQKAQKAPAERAKASSPAADETRKRAEAASARKAAAPKQVQTIAK